jgi:hypothetical protein
MTGRLAIRRVLIVGLLLQLSAPSLAGGRMSSELICRPGDSPLTVHCTIELSDRDTGEPIEGAELVIQTSMPTMPLAHNMPPVEAMPGERPGTYHATFRFEMPGEWAIDIRTSAPVRDQVRHTIMVAREGLGEPPEHEMHQTRERD